MGNSQTKGQAKARQKKQVHWKSAERPGPPGKPQLVPGAEITPDVVTIRWDKPQTDGGTIITGYLVEHRRTGSPHWVRATPLLVPTPELTLSGLEPGWRYQFRITAQNVVGMSDPGEMSEPLTVTLQRSVIAAPKFTEELHETTALENEMAEFEVHVIGQPPPKICWFKDGFEIFSSRRTRIISENDKSVLTIHQVSLADEGEIKCTATNKAGHASTKCVIKVEAPPVIRLPRQYEDGLLFELDEVMRLKVSIAGRPQPLVFWSHNGESIQRDERYEITDSDKSSVLKVGEAKRADRGEYQIRAVNKLGEDSTSFLVTVTDKPQPPRYTKVIMSLGKSVTLSWDVPEDDGGCKIGNYIVEYYRIGWNVWLKAATCRHLSTTLSDLIEGSEYKFRVKAESPYGVSDPSDETDVIFIPDPKRGLLAPPPRSRSLNRENQRETLPVAPKRRSTSSTRSSNKEQPVNTLIFPSSLAPTPPKRERIKSPQKTPENSPLLQRKYMTGDRNMFDRSSLTRELSYGSPEIKYKKPEVKSPQYLEPKPIETTSKNKTPSPIITRERSPSIINQLLSNILPKKPSVSPCPSPRPSPPKEDISPKKTPSPVIEHKEVFESSLKGDRLDRLSPNIVNRRSSSPFVLDQREKSPSPMNINNRNRSPSFVESMVDKNSNLSPMQSSNSPTSIQRSNSPTPIQRSNSPTPIQRSNSPTPIQRSNSPTPIQRSNSPTPIQRNNFPTPMQRSNSPTLMQTSNSPTTIQRSNSPTPMQINKSPTPMQRSNSPTPMQRSNSPTPMQSSKSPSPNSATNKSPSPNPSANRSPSPVRYSPSNDDGFRRDSMRSYHNNNDMAHGSSEFMLVLVDDQDDVSHDFFMFENSLVPPPMSLSAPELGANSDLFMPLKTSASSTELLHERAFARFMKDAEESNKGITPDRISLGRKGSFERNQKPKIVEIEGRRSSIPKILINSKDSEDINELENKTSFARRLSAGVSNMAQHYLWAKRRNSLQNTEENPELTDVNSKYSDKLKDITKERSISEEKEDEELSRVRSNTSNNDVRKNSFSKVEDKTTTLNQQESFEESIYSETESEEESESEDERLKENISPPNIEIKDEPTYHPRMMIPTTVSKYEEPFEILTKPSPLPDPNFIPKPILKRKEPEPKKPTPDKPVRRYFGSKEDNLSRPLSPLPTRDRSDRSRTPSPSRGEKKRQASPAPARSIQEAQMISAGEAARNKRMNLNRHSSQEEYKVVADHYMNLVREYGTNKRPQHTLFLNRDELKAAAESDDHKSSEENLPVKREPSPVRNTSRRDTITSTKRETSRNSSSTRTGTKRNPSPCPIRKPMDNKQVGTKPKSLRSRSSSRTGDNSRTVTPTSLKNKLMLISRSPSPRPLTPEQEALQAEAEIKVRSTVDYMTDVAMFIVACWLYLFKDARLAIPVLVIMVYRQLKDEVKNMLPAWMIKSKKS